MSARRSPRATKASPGPAALHRHAALRLAPAVAAFLEALLGRCALRPAARAEAHAGDVAVHQVGNEEFADVGRRRPVFSSRPAGSWFAGGAGWRLRGLRARRRARPRPGSRRGSARRRRPSRPVRRRTPRHGAPPLGSDGTAREPCGVIKVTVPPASEVITPQTLPPLRRVRRTSSARAAAGARAIAVRQSPFRPPPACRFFIRSLTSLSGRSWHRPVVASKDQDNALMISHPSGSGHR